MQLKQGYWHQMCKQKLMWQDSRSGFGEPGMKESPEVVKKTSVLILTSLFLFMWLSYVLWVCRIVPLYYSTVEQEVKLYSLQNNGASRF